MTLWDYYIEQAEMTLNMMRTSCIHSHLSAYQHLYGDFDFKKTPLCPPGQQVAVHVRKENRTSWGLRGEQGWYDGPALEHYQCHTIYVLKTRSTRISDTIDFFSHGEELPTVTPIELATHAALQLEKILKTPTPATKLIFPTDKHFSAL